MPIEKFGKASYEDIKKMQEIYSVTFPKEHVENKLYRRSLIWKPKNGTNISTSRKHLSQYNS